MSPTKIKESLSEAELLQIYRQIGEAEISRDQMIASIMFVMNMGEKEASDFVDWNLAQHSQMEADMEIRGKLQPLEDSIEN
jgi:cell fate (sporulation/competence/biofilm development) regulator YmcA (YheA/YmcA/DUF963 family)